MEGRTRKNVIILALCQALFMTGASLVITVTALAGNVLAEAKSLATLPLALQFLVTMATTIPASLLMKRIGRRLGFITGALIGAAGGFLSVHALFAESFILFCIGSALIGVLNGFAMFYRFAAADAADEALRSRAISLVMAGGVIAAFAGPNLAKFSKDFFDVVTFAGSYGALALLQGFTILLLMFIDIPKPDEGERRASGRPLSRIMRQPTFVVAALAAMTGYGAMNLIMTATPLAMVDHDYPFADAAFVVQWHVFCMFAPSFFTGHLINRFGVLEIIIFGGVLVLACVGINLAGRGLFHFLSALALLGVGWNFLFIGATTLLSTAHSAPEKAKTQGFNDFLVFACVALASLSSGAIQNGFGWEMVNYGLVPFILPALAATFWLKLKRPALAA